MPRHDRRAFLKTIGGAATIGGLAGCIEDLSGGGSDTLEQVGYTSYVRGGAWITAYVEAAEFYAEDQGIELDVRPNQQSASKQVQDIRDFVNQGYDGILVGVWQTGAAEDAIASALDEDIPVIATNADTSNPDIPLYVGFSNYDGGAQCAEEMLAALEEQKPDADTWRVLNVRGVQGNQSANQRSEGFLEVMEEEDNVEVMRTINGEYARDVALQNTQEWINANEVPDGIYSGNLSMGLGVVEALENLDLDAPKSEDDHIVLTQMDGSAEVNPLVGDGYIDAAVDQPNYFYNPIGMYYLREFVEGDGYDSVPEVGDEITEGDIEIEPAQHKGVNLWEEPIWSPAPIREQNGHPWFRTNSITITEENYDSPALWGNVWG